MPEEQKDKTLSWLLKLCTTLMIGYFVLAIVFYYLAGESLHIRDSRNNFEVPNDVIPTTELVGGVQIEQVVYPQMDILDTLSIRWGTYYRNNSGIVHIKVIDYMAQSVLAEKTIDIVDIEEGAVSKIQFEDGLKIIYGRPLVISLSNPDGVVGSSIMPLATAFVDGMGPLLINGQPQEAYLCIGASGRDYVWTGTHYIQLVLLGALLLLGFLRLEIVLYKKRKKALIVQFCTQVIQYHFLISQLVIRDFKAKYKRSFLGVFWSFFNPLLTMAVQYFVFSNIFKHNIPNYQVYLLCGVVFFHFFSESCTMTLMSIVGNSNLIKKVYVPKYIYPLSRTFSSAVNFLIALIPLFLVVFLSGLSFARSYVLLIFDIVCLIGFCLGLGMLLSSSMVFFRDTQFLWNVLITIWTYATPIFYSESILSPQFMLILKLNPMYYYIKFARVCIIDGVSPEPMLYLACFGFAIAFLSAGAAVFKKLQNNFVLHL